MQGISGCSDSPKDENEARLFEEALDELYPLGWSDKKEDKKHYLQEDTWYFLRGEFFDAMKGFLVRVDESGKLIQIDYLLKAVE